MKALAMGPLALLGLGAAILALDVLLPYAGVGALYALLVGLTSGERRIWFVSGSVTALALIGAILGALHGSSGVASQEIAFDLGLTLAFVWTVAWLTLARETTQSRFDLLFRTASNGFLLVDERGRIELANPFSERLFGYGPGEMEGLAVEELMPEGLRANHRDLRSEYLAEPVQRMMGSGRELPALHRDGSALTVEIGLSPARADAMRIHRGPLILCTIVDLSERVRTRSEREGFVAEIERSTRELDSFAYMASHDLKSPLRAIGLLAQWAEEDSEGRLTTQSSEHLATLRQRIDRLNRLLDDMLAYSRVGRAQAAAEEIDVAALVREAAELIDSSGLRVETSADLPRCRAPRSLLLQVFMNLLGNAVKHHDRTQGTVRVAGRAADDGVEYTVEDDGPGIRLEDRERVFEMFRTLRPRDEVEGSGMGLAIVRKAIESLGGSIAVEEGEGRGARFALRLPSALGTGSGRPTGALPGPTVGSDAVQEAPSRG